MKILKIFQAILALAIICASCDAPVVPDVPMHKPDKEENKGDEGGSNSTDVDLSVKKPSTRRVLTLGVFGSGYFTERSTSVEFYYGKSDTTSSIAVKQKAIAAVNACYELDAIYCKTNGVLHVKFQLILKN